MIIHSYMVPLLYRSHLDNKKYVIADGEWTEVDEDFKWGDIKWFQKEFKGKGKGKNEALKINLDWEVDGSKGKKYTVRLNDNVWSCSCPAYGWSGSRRSCKHIEQIKKDL